MRMWGDSWQERGCGDKRGSRVDSWWCPVPIRVDLDWSLLVVSMCVALLSPIDPCWLVLTNVDPCWLVLTSAGLC